jgi:hypothetical protein
MEQNESVVEESARAKWSRIIDQQRSSGLPVAVFCRERSLAVSSYYGWRRKLSGGPIDPGFIEARVVGEPEVEDKQSGGGGAFASNSSGVRIELSGGRQILLTRGFDRLVLLEVIQVLEGLPSKLEGIAPAALASS